MNKTTIILVIANLALTAGVFSLAMKSNDTKGDNKSTGTYTVNVIKKTATETAANSVLLKKGLSTRKKRLTSRYFIAAPGQRNALTDFVDGMVIEGMKRRILVSDSFNKLLKEEAEEMTKEESQKVKKTFKKIMTNYLQEVYKIQRGSEEGDIADLQVQMRGQLSSELGLNNARLSRLEEIEKDAKSSRQLSAYKKLLIRDKDKLSEEQSAELKSVLISQQQTVFDLPESTDTAFKRSESTLDDASQNLSSDQSAHFRYFQEYHWHSYDFQEMNDMSNRR
jgi:hypothetical protein